MRAEEDVARANKFFFDTVQDSYVLRPSKNLCRFLQLKTRLPLTLKHMCTDIKRLWSASVQR